MVVRQGVLVACAIAALACVPAVAAFGPVSDFDNGGAAVGPYYVARDNQGGSGGPTNAYSTYNSAGLTWTCPAAAQADEGYPNVLGAATGAGFPATFKFYNTDIAAIRLGSNGGLGFSTGTAGQVGYDPAEITYYPFTLIEPVWPDSIVAGFWDDWDATGMVDGLCWAVTGTGTEHVFLARWKDVPHLDVPSSTLTQMIVLFERGNAIEVHHNGGIPDGDNSQGINWYDATSDFGWGVKYSFGPTARTTEAIQYRPVSTFPTATNDGYSLVYSTYGGILKVDANAYGPQPAMAKVTTNDFQIGNVAVDARVLTLPGTGTLKHLVGGVCGANVAVNDLLTAGSFCFDATAAGTAACTASPITFTYRADDAYPNDTTAPLQDVATVTLTVSSCNQAPVAGNDPQTWVSGTPSTYYLATEDSILTIGATAPGSVNPINGCPQNAGLLCNDTDPDGATQTSSLVVDLPSINTAGITSGTLSGPTAGGAFTFTPTANACGTNSFTYRAKDTPGSLSNNATAYIRIACAHDAPNATADSYTLNEDESPYTQSTACAFPSNFAKGVLCNDTDPDTADSDTNLLTAGIGDHATNPTDAAIQCLAPGQLPQHAASFTLNPDGSFTYTPVAQYYGPDAFWYKVRDGRTDIAVESACVQVTLNVTSIADAPDAVADSYSNIPNSGSTIVSAATGLLANDVDNDNGPNGQVANYGLMVAGSVPSVTCGAPATATLSAYNADGSFTIVLNNGGSATYTGTCWFTYTVSDGTLTDTANVTLSIVAPNAPFAISDACTLQEDIIVTTPAFVSPIACGNLSDGDVQFTGAGAGVPFYWIVAQPPAAHGLVTILDSATGQYKFEPATHFNGATSFTYRFTQSNPATGLPETSAPAIVGVTVLAVNDFPTATAKNYTLNEDCSATSAASCATPFTVPAACGGAVEGLLCELATYDPDPADSPNNAVSVVVPAPFSTSLGQVTAITAAGGFTYRPNPHAYGTDTFTIVVMDDGNSTSPNVATNPTPITVTLHILPVEDPPVALEDPCDPVYPTSAYVPECTAASPPYLAYYGHMLTVPASIGVLANDYDPDNFPDAPLSNVGLQVDCAVGCSLLPGEGSLSLGADGTVYYIPPATGSACMDVTFLYRAQDTDGELSALTPVAMVVCPNMPPVADFWSNTDTIEQGGSIVFHDFSSDSDGTVVAWLWQFGDGQTSSLQDPIHTYLEAGVYTVTLTVTDDIGDSDGYTSTVTVYYHPDPSGSAPVATSIQARAGVDQSVQAGAEVQLAGSAIGTTSPEFRWSQVSGPTVSLQGANTANPTFVAPPVLSAADVRLRLVVVDGSRESDPDEMVVRVAPVNRAPSVAVTAPREVDVGDTVTLDAHATQDPDGDTISFSWAQIAGPRIELQGESDGDSRAFVVPASAAGQTVRIRVVASDGRLTGVNEIVIFVRNAPDTEPLFELAAIAPDGTATFEALRAGTTLWSFGDGPSVASGATVDHKYREGGTYLVTVQIKDSSGATRSYTQSVEIPPVALAAEETSPAAVAAEGSSLVWVFVAAGFAIVAVAGGAWIVVRGRRK